MARTFSNFVVVSSIILQVILIVVSYLADKAGTTDLSDMPNFETMGIAMVGMLLLAFIFCLNIVFTFVAINRKMRHLVIALTTVVTFILMVFIGQHFNQ